MRSPSVVSYIFAAFLVVGCSDLLGFNSYEVHTETYEYTAYDSTGQAVVKGQLRLTFEQLGDDEDTFELDGAWDLQQIRKTKRPIGKQTGQGELRGTIYRNGRVEMDLYPELVDASVSLRGEFQGERRDHLKGEWSYRSWALVNGGKFEAMAK